MGKWDFETGDLNVISDPAKMRRPTPEELFERDKPSYQNAIDHVTDDDLKAHMQEALDQGNQDLLDTLLKEAEFNE